MYKADLSGNRYGKLLVVSYSHMGKYNETIWKCLCDCGNTTLVSSHSLKRKDGRSTISCGCMRGKRPHLKNDVAFNSLVIGYKAGAKKRNLEFSISTSHMKWLMGLNCYYCGSSPKQKKTVTGSPDVFIYNGIDRVDNTKGYVDGNCVPCCKNCNRAKNSMSYSDFKEWIALVSDNMFSKEMLRA